jgi:tRNA A-37 threonylcarbamoyl transferase component Bud32/predicted RNA-binding Zn-ribbon protein involved in translation (DUF1610 family)
MSAVEQQYLSTCPSCDEQIDVTGLEPFMKLQCPHCSELIRVRRKFDHFVIIKQIGEGGMSRVFEAEDETLGRRVALKILNRQYSRDAVRIEQFRQEALITAKVTHPNVIKLYSVGYDQGYFYIAMELVGGGSLDQRIKREGTIAEGDALRIGREVAEGLRAAERMGLIHRDVKPANILFTETGTAKVVDFGLAIFADRADESGTEIWATPFYVAPEKVIENKEDYRSDMFSLGATIYHALTGKPPHKADTNSIQELRMIKCRRVQLEESGLPYRPRTCHVVNQLVAFNPSERFEDYDKVVEELRLAEGLAEHSILRRGSRRMKALVGAAAALTIAFSTGWIIRNTGEKKARSLVVSPSLIAKDVMGEGDTLTAGVVTTADKFIEARNVLLSGKFDQAKTMFDAIISGGAKQPTLNFARFNAALCSVVRGQRGEAQAYFDAIGKESGAASVSGARDMGAFFQKLGSLMHSTLGLNTQVAKLDYSINDEELLGYLALGLTKWHFGDDLADARDGAKCIGKFLAGRPARGLEWVSSYRVLVEPYLKDMEVVRSFSREIQKNEKPATIEEAQDLLADVARMKEQLQTSGAVKTKIEKTELMLQKELGRLKLAEQQKLLAERIERQKREMEQLTEISEILPSLVQGYDFSAALSILKDISFEAGEVREALEGKRYLYTKAQEFVAVLMHDVNTKGCAARVNRYEGGMLQGRATAVDQAQLRIALDRGVIAIPLSTVTAETLVEMAQTFCNAITDSTEFYRRRELIAAFARVKGLSNTSSTVAAELMEDNRGFRERWARVLMGGG